MIRRWPGLAVSARATAGRADLGRAGPDRAPRPAAGCPGHARDQPSPAGGALTIGLSSSGTARLGLGLAVVSTPWAEPGRGLFSIAVAAELTGLHPQTLRFYEQEGLLRPARSSGGTRRYSTDDIDRLHQIMALTSDGLNSLACAGCWSCKRRRGGCRPRSSGSKPRPAARRGRGASPSRPAQAA